MKERKKANELQTCCAEGEAFFGFGENGMIYRVFFFWFNVSILVLLSTFVSFRLAWSGLLYSWFTFILSIGF
jgi:hypothetical protein